MIGRLHLQGVSRVWVALGEERRELNVWLTRREVSKGRLHAGLNRLEAHLSRHWPEVPGLLELRVCEKARDAEEIARGNAVKMTVLK